MYIRQTIAGCIAATALTGLAGAANASTVTQVGLAGIPDGGGATPDFTLVSGSGIGFTGGIQWRLDNIDQAAFDQLWYGFFDPEGAMDGLVNSPGEILTYNAGLSDADTAVWLGQTTVHTAGGAISVDTRFTMEIIAGGSFVSTPAAISALTPGMDAVLPEITGSSFEFLWTLEAMNTLAGQGPSDSFVAFLPYYDSVNQKVSPSGSGAAISGYQLSGFYYTENPGASGDVPLPAALPLLGSTMAVAGFFGWRRKKSADA